MRLLLFILVFFPSIVFGGNYVDTFWQMKSGVTPRNIANWLVARGLPGWDQAEDPDSPELWAGEVNTPPRILPIAVFTIPGPWDTTAAAGVWTATLAMEPVLVGLTDRKLPKTAAGTLAGMEFKEWGWQAGKLFIHAGTGENALDPNDFQIKYTVDTEPPGDWTWNIRFKLSDAIRIKREFYGQIPPSVDLLSYRSNGREWKDVDGGEEDCDPCPNRLNWEAFIDDRIATVQMPKIGGR